MKTEAEIKKTTKQSQEEQSKPKSNTFANYISLPFPIKRNWSKKGELEKELLETFQKVKVNIPLLDAIRHVSRYAKFLKKLCTSKRKLKGNKILSVGENVSVIIQHKLFQKCKDLGTFTIPCIIENQRIERAMLDLGASINVMPHSIYASLKSGPLK